MRSAVVLLFATLVALPLRSQVTTETAPPEYGGVQTRVRGVFVTPIPNVPMTALVDISSMRTLPDGSMELRRTEAHIARTSSGKIYNDMRAMMPAAFQGQPRLLGIHVYDPQTRVSLMWNPFQNVVHSMTLTGQQIAERKPFLIAVRGATDQDLGTSTMSGVTVHGLRRVREIPMQGTGAAARPVAVTDEYWYSEDLHLIMLEKHNDPRTGEQIVSILDVKRAEPAAQLFEPPKSYRVVDVTATGSDPTDIDPFATPAPARAPVQTVNVH